MCALKNRSSPGDAKCGYRRLLTILARWLILPICGLSVVHFPLLACEVEEKLGRATSQHDNHDSVPTLLSRYLQEREDLAKRLQAHKRLIEKGKRAVPQLVNELRPQNEPRVRCAASEILLEIMRGAGDVVLTTQEVSLVAKAVETGEYTVASALTVVLEMTHERGSDTRAALDSLRANLKSSDKCRQVICARCLATLDSTSRSKMVGFLVEQATGPVKPGEHHQSTAFRALEQLGPVAKEALPKLRAHLADKRPGMRISAASAMVRIDASQRESYQVLLREIESDNWAVRQWALLGLQDIGGAPEDVRNTVIKRVSGTLDDPNEDVRETAREVLRRIESTPRKQ